MLVVSGGCAGAGPPVETSSSSEFDRLQTSIFNQHCLSAGCHNSQSQAGAMDLSAGAAYDALVNVAPDNPLAKSEGFLRVEPLHPDNSFLIRKLRGPAPGEGTRMPQGMAPLAESDIAAIETWILHGAPRGETAAPSATPTEIPSTPTDTPTPSVTATATQTLTPANTATVTVTVTGTPPPTLTPSATPSASPSPSPSPTIAAPTLAELQQRIFSTTCVDIFCHTRVDMAGNMVLEDEQSSYDSLVVNNTPDNALARSSGLLRVDPGNPDNSYLLVKLNGPTNPRLGSPMPLGKLPLSAEDIQLVHDWIAAGAQR